MFRDFTGEYNHTVDAKGRVIVPSKFREQLGESFVVTRGFDNCLTVYADPDWKDFSEKVNALPITDPRARKMKRFFLAGAVTCEVDKQGRILLPANLREFAGIDKEAVLAGVGDHIEICSREAWSEHNDFDDMDELAASMEGLGI